MPEGQYMRAITTKFYGPTDTRGSRVVATEGTGIKATVDFDHAQRPEASHDEACRKLCRMMGWKGARLIRSTLNGGWVYVDATGDSVDV